MWDAERETLLAIAEVASPAGRHLPPPNGDLCAAVDELLAGLGPTGQRSYRAMLTALDLAAVPLAGRRLSRLPAARRGEVLAKLARASATFWLIRGVTAPIKMARVRSRALREWLDMDERRLPVARERNAWEERILDARLMEQDEEIEVDVVVVGTGAGGAPVARTLAARGHAVLMLEEGPYFTRADFNGEPMEMQARLYRDAGATVALGNTIIPIPLGRSVGGSTLINSGTCYRTPAAVERRWELEGLKELRPGALDPYYERVEAMLEVAPVEERVLGGCARVIARGCDVLGYRHGPLRRNAPGCDGEGVCCFGCPTGAKRSTDVSYVPAALEHGAMLYTHAKVTRILVEGGRAQGVVARARREDGRVVRLTVRAPAVVLACGAVHTPALLLRNEIANGSGQVGQKLTIHPASYGWGLFDEPIRGFEGVPQGYSVEEFVDQGIRFEGAFLPLGLAAGSLGPIGPRWTELVESYDRLACFGFMIEETSRGRVVLGPGGKPQMIYVLNDADVRKLVQAHAILARIFLAAGARAVYPSMQLYDELRSEADVERLEREGVRELRAHHLDVTAYHPLGTCRMGSDPARSVCGPTHETHEVERLFLCDGSVVPGPLGVNPQVTIMAMAERACAFVERRIEQGMPAAAPAAPAERRVAFEETMSGRCELLDGSGDGSRRRLFFQVRALGRTSLREGLRKLGAVMELEGELTLDGIATAVPCRGTLRMRPLRSRATLVYDLAFRGDDGAEMTLHGEKHVKAYRPVRGARTLHTEVRRGGELLARGVLRFDLRDLRPWLESFRLATEPRADAAE